MRAVVVWERGSNKHDSISEDDSVQGCVIFYQFSREYPVIVKVHLDGLPDGVHGFHVHERGLKDVDAFSGEVSDCCEQMGGHFNVGQKWSPEHPHGTPHGEHTGDLCMNLISWKGYVKTTFVDDKISLYRGDNCIIGRGLVIHSDEDDMGIGIYEDEEKIIESKKTGNAGKRIACGTIVRMYDP